MMGSMGAALAAAASPGQATPAFDPSTIPSIKYFAQTDNAIDDGAGKCASIASLVGASEVFDQPSAGNRFTLNTSIISGHTVLRTTNTDFPGTTYTGQLQRLASGSLFGQFSAVSSCIGLYIRFEHTNGLSNTPYNIRENAAPTSNRIRVSTLVPNTGGQATYVRTQAGTGTTYTLTPSPALPLNTWLFLAWNYNASTGAVRFYIDAVLKLTVAGTARSPVNLDSLTVGQLGGTNAIAAIGGFFGCTQELEAADQLAVFDGYRSMFDQ